MEIITRQLNNKTIAEIVAHGLIMQTAEQGTDLVGELTPLLVLSPTRAKYRNNNSNKDENIEKKDSFKS